MGLGLWTAGSRFLLLSMILAFVWATWPGSSQLQAAEDAGSETPSSEPSGEGERMSAGAAALLQALSELARDEKQDGERPLLWLERSWSETSQEAKNYVAGKRELLEDLRKAIGGARESYLPLGNDPWSWHKSWMPILDSARQGTCLLVMESKKLRSEGRYDEAVADLKAGAELAKILQTRSPLTAILVSYVYLQMTFQSGLYPLLRDDDAPKECLSACVELCADGYAPDFEFLEWESDIFRKFCMDLGKALEDRDIDVLQRYARERIIVWGDEEDAGDPAAAYEKLDITAEACREAPPIYDDVLRRMLAATHVPYASFVNAEEFSAGWIQAAYRGNALVRMDFPVLLPALRERGRMRAWIRADRIIAALRLFKIQEDRYPQTLDELVPGVLPSVPIDPFSEKPFRYRQDEYAVIICSFGPDLKDDGGRTPWGPPDEKGDLIWVLPTVDASVWREKERERVGFGPLIRDRE